MGSLVDWVGPLSVSRAVHDDCDMFRMTWARARAGHKWALGKLDLGQDKPGCDMRCQHLKEAGLIASGVVR
jgi:hypothetical protein